MVPKVKKRTLKRSKSALHYLAPETHLLPQNGASDGSWPDVGSYEFRVTWVKNTRCTQAIQEKGSVEASTINRKITKPTTA